jgi:hypothetical protein
LLVTFSGRPPNRFLREHERSKGEPCSEAETFAGWLGEYVTPHLGQSLSYSQVATLKWLTLDKWQELRKNLPAGHSNRFNQHPCVDELFQATYDRLHMLQLGARPPDLTALEWMTKPKRRSKKGAGSTPEDVDAVLDQLIFGVEEPR